jgi:hypothetical protein
MMKESIKWKIGHIAKELSDTIIEGEVADWPDEILIGLERAKDEITKASEP